MSKHSDIVFHRPPRVRPHWTPTTLDLPTPPEPPQPADGSAWLSAGMSLVGVVLLALAMVFVNAGGSVLMFVLPMGAMAVVSVVSTLLMNREQQRRGQREFAEASAFFEERLSALEQEAERIYEHERKSRLELSPSPDEVLQIVGVRGGDGQLSHRLWERRIDDDDFLDLRVGLGEVPSCLTIRLPQPTRNVKGDRRLREVAERFAQQRGVPITIPLATLGSLSVAGERRDVIPLIHALIWQVVALHSPDDLRLAAVVGVGRDSEWDWLRWLPHTIPLNNDQDRRVRMVAAEPEGARRLLSALLDELSKRRDQLEKRRDGPPPRFLHVMVLIEDLEHVRDQPALVEIMRQGAALGMSVLFVGTDWKETPDQCAAMVNIQHPSSATWVRADDDWSNPPFKPDDADKNYSDRLARRLAGIQLAAAGGSRDLPRSVRLFDLLGITDERQLNPPAAWHEETPEGSWHPYVPIGSLGGDEKLYLDLNQERHGPHGIIAGTTGAGKSVLLQCIIASLAACHSPVRFQVLLIDFKGGASLAMFKDLPHVVGFVTDLEGRLAERAMTAIKSEIRFRKNLLKQTAARLGVKKLEDIKDYRALAARHGLEPLPNLLIVIDEFDELRTTYPEFVTELVRVVKQGRSLGVHLLIATQQPSKAVTDEIRTQLKYFIALRLGSGEDSREMILKSDAAFLPTDIPGRAYFRVGSNLSLFQVAQVTGEFRRAEAGQGLREPEVTFLDPRFQSKVVNDARLHRESGTEQPMTDLDVLVAQLSHAGRAAIEAETRRTGWRPRPIWQPPLPARLSLIEIDPELSPERNLWSMLSTDRWLTPALGRVDIPQESRQETLRIPLHTGHLAIVGAPGSGKTMLLRTLLLHLALTHSPEDLWCYVIDAGGQGLSPLAKLPHMGALVQVRERERIRRLFLILNDIVRERQDRFREAGVADLAAYRANHEPLPAVVVVIDKIALLREELKDDFDADDIIDQLVTLVRISAPYGVHLVITADRVADMTGKLLSLIEQRLALWLPELYDYTEVVGGRVTAPIPANLPGRGLWMHPDVGLVDVQVALPLLEAPTGVEHEDASGEQAMVLDSELLADLRETVAALRQQWEALPSIRRVKPQSIELLPDQIDLDQLEPIQAPSATDDALLAPIGRESLRNRSIALVLSAETPHALVVGPRRSGKTTAIQTTVLSLARRYRPEELRIAIIDGPRRGLRALRGLEHVEKYAQTEDEVKALVSDLSSVNGGKPRWLIVIDDYDLCRAQMSNQFLSFSDTPNLYSLLRNVAGGGHVGMHMLIGSGSAYADDEILRALDNSRNGLILWPGRYESGTRWLTQSLPLKDQRTAHQPPGRALLVREDALAIVQIARVVDVTGVVTSLSRGVVYGA